MRRSRLGPLPEGAVTKGDWGSVLSLYATLHLIVDYGADTVEILIYIQITESNDF